MSADWSVRVNEIGKGAAKSRQQLLEDARVVREARRDAKAQAMAATTLQACWRGHRARTKAVQEVCRGIVDTALDAVKEHGARAPTHCFMVEVLQPLVAVSLSHASPAAVVPHGAVPVWQQAFRSAAVLVLRSLSSEVEEQNLATMRQPCSNSAANLRLYARLALLCALAADPAGDLACGVDLINVAAARCLYLLTEPVSSKAWQVSSQQARAAHAAAAVEMLAGTEAVFKACAGATEGMALSPRACMNWSAYPMETSASVPYGVSALQAVPNHGGEASGAKAKAALNLTRVAMRMLTGGEGGSSSSGPVAARNCLTWMVTPTALLSNMPMLRSQLLGAPPYTALTLLLRQLWWDTTLSPAKALLSLSALCAVVAGPCGLQTSAKGQRIALLPPSVGLGDPAVRLAYLEALLTVLQKAAVSGCVRRLDAAARRHVVILTWPLSQTGHLNALLAGRSDRLDGEHGDAENGLDALIGAYSALIDIAEAVDSLEAKVATERDVQQMLPPVENLLAFNGEWLRLLWPRVATVCRWPLEVPGGAGGSLPESFGVASLSKWQADCALLFCRCYDRYLKVLDEEAFWGVGGGLLSLGTHRAAALALNALVFWTYMGRRPASDEAAVHRGPSPVHLSLLTHAEQCLRELHARHVRRPFLAEGAWIMPWHQASQHSQALQGGRVLVDTVVKLIMRSAADEEEAVAGGEGGVGTAAPWRVAKALPRGGGGGGSVGGTTAAAVATLFASAPHTIPYALRVDLFRRLLQLDKESLVTQGVQPRKISVRRGHIMDDAYAQLATLGSGIKAPLSVSFYDQHGIQEAGIDQGGLLKELLEELVTDGFDERRGLFCRTAAGEAYPSPAAPHSAERGLAALEFLGLIVGKALYEGLLLNVELAPLFIMALQRRSATVEDLTTLDPELYRALMQVKRYEGDVEDLGLDFTVTEDIGLGRRRDVELIPRGAATPVTAESRLMYVLLTAHWHIARICGAAAEAFARGLAQVVPLSYFRMFSTTEVNELLGGGTAVELDAADMRRHAQYQGGYSSSSLTIRAFWSVVAGMGEGERRDLLKFVTGTGRAPLGGFAHLEPPLTIAKVDCGASVLARLGGPDVDRLPTASTCFNTLKLPNYRRTSTMRRKLLYAIRAKAGFDLS